MVYKEFIDKTEEELAKIYPREEGRAIAVRLLQHFCGLSSYEHIVEPFGEIPGDKLLFLKSAAGQLAAARPLQYVLGFEEFCGHKFFVKEGVLIPRPETEELVRWAVEEIAEMIKKSNPQLPQPNETYHKEMPIKILDAACGSGCIGISLACELPGSEVFMCDISNEALDVSAINISGSWQENTISQENDGKIIENISHDKVAKNITSFGTKSACLYSNIPKQNSCPHSSKPILFYGDLLAGPLSQTFIGHSSLDVLISNPPYIRESERTLMHKNVLDFEPSIALFVPDNDPLIFYKALAKWGIELLHPGGLLFLEINESLGRETIDMLTSYGYSNISLRSDINGRERMVRAVSPGGARESTPGEIC